MNITLEHKEKQLLSGRSILRAWAPGVLKYWMDCGLNLHQAQEVARGCGNLVAEFKTHNLVVDSGLELMAKLLSEGGANGLTYHSIGTNSTTPAVGDTALGTEVSRKVWTINGYGSNILSLSVYYLSSECTFNLVEAGVWGGSASATPGSGTLFSHYVQPYDNSAGDVDLTYDYDLEILR